MDQQTLKAIVEELTPVLTGRTPGKLFQLTPLSLAIDFHLRDSRYLFVGLEPNLPRLYLINRRPRDLEKQLTPQTRFALMLRKELSDTKLVSVEKDREDRVVRFSFAGHDVLGESSTRTLVAQLTGRTANLFLLNESDKIIGLLRTARGIGQNPGETYQPPIARGSRSRGPATGRAMSVNSRRIRSSSVREGGNQQIVSDAASVLNSFQSGKFSSLSAAADAYYQALAAEKAFDDEAAAARGCLRKEISRNRTLLKRLRLDLAQHADAEQQKRIGDLLLANLTTAERDGSKVKLVDYFADDAPAIEIEIDEHSSLPAEAERRFDSYSRSKRAVPKIENRIAAIELELIALQEKRAQLEQIITERDAVALNQITRRDKPGPVKPEKQKPKEKISGVRNYLSSDGCEILVGRTSRDNDHLTFKIARPNDLWLHAGDYPGSHVVVRNPTRKEIPQRTIIEAAQLAAYFSQARKDAKVSIHYTQRKFLSKPKGAAPGLVRLSRFKTMNVAPKESVGRILP